jgi:RNA polymerase sigma factor FliA
MENTKHQKTDIDEELNLWLSFKNSNDAKLREKLISKYMNFATSIAANTFKLRTLSNVDYKDYVQYAMIGLIEAVDKFKPNLAASFKTYSSYRIRGSILNGLTKDSELSAQIKFNKSLKEERLNSIVEADLAIDDKEEFLEMHNLIVPLAIQYVLDNTLIEDRQSVDNEDIPYHEYAFTQLKENLLNQLESLPQKHNKVIRYHYLGHLSFERVGDLLGLTKGRISQIHKEAIFMLRDSCSELKNIDISF